MNEPRYIRVMAMGCLSLGLVFMAMGSRMAYDVKPDPNAKVELPPVSAPNFVPLDPDKLPAPKPLSAEQASINDWTLLANTTFTGVARRDDGLHYTYDPAQSRGKRSCPT
jgi:hypothetical protein